MPADVPTTTSAEAEKFSTDVPPIVSTTVENDVRDESTETVTVAGAPSEETITVPAATSEDDSQKQLISKTEVAVEEGSMLEKDIRARSASVSVLEQSVGKQDVVQGSPPPKITNPASPTTEQKLGSSPLPRELTTVVGGTEESTKPAEITADDSLEVSADSAAETVAPSTNPSSEHNSQHGSSPEKDTTSRAGEVGSRSPFFPPSPIRTKIRSDRRFSPQVSTEQSFHFITCF